MNQDRSELTCQVYDVLIIGGGINGTAIAHLAAKRGLKVALIEKGDFASGTSSKSTKLLHGGIRYLENLEFDLVHESLVERAIQLKSAPHLSAPIRFIIPVYQTDQRPLWQIKLGVWIYHFLSVNYRVGKPSSLSAQDLSKIEPNLTTEGLSGAVSYYDVQMNDARFCLENALSARSYGAHVHNYVKVVSFLKDNGRLSGVLVCDCLREGSPFEVKAKRIISTVGPWSNGLVRLAEGHGKKIIRTTKGVHLVYKTQLSKNALLINSQPDKRIFFVIPYKDHSLIGTTDTDFVGNPDHVRAEERDVDYLLNQAARVFPGIPLRREEIISTFAGLRPLIRKSGMPGKISRRHLIKRMESGLIVVIGGKFTTYRKIAEDCVNQIIPQAPDGEFTLYGSNSPAQDPTEAARLYGIDLETAQVLSDFYGSRYDDVLKLTVHSPGLKEKICSCSPYIKAQVLYALETEMARTADDIIERRLSLHYRYCPTRNCFKVIEEIVRASQTPPSY